MTYYDDLLRKERIVRYFDDPHGINEVYATTVEAVIDALEALGFEGGIVCADGSEPCASLDLGDDTWLDVTVQVRT